MTNFLSRNWVLVLALGGMAFMHFGMNRGHGKTGVGGGCCGGGSNKGRKPAATTGHESDTAGRRQESHPEGAMDSPMLSPQDTPVPSESSVKVEDAPQEQRSRGGCC